jgi:hypothetical protein
MAAASLFVVPRSMPMIRPMMVTLVWVSRAPLGGLGHWSRLNERFYMYVTDAEGACERNGGASEGGVARVAGLVRRRVLPVVDYGWL